MRKYLENCQLTCKRALQLLCFSLISKLWDYKKENSYTLSPEQAITCRNFFEDEFELDIKGFANLLKTLTEIFTANQLSFPIVELNEYRLPLDSGSDFLIACHQLQELDKLLETASYSVQHCTEAENNLATVLATLNFLVNYKMESIKSIGYFEMRNSKPHYLYNYTALGIDVKSNINQEMVNYQDVPINTDAVLLYKGNYQQNINLFPFVIDENALKLEGGTKICFYACHNLSDGSLNYNFLEDNSTVNIANTGTLQTATDMNALFLDPKKRKDLRFDAVYTLFQEAKKAITGLENDDFLNGF